MDNLGQVATNIQDSEMPGCSYWSNPVPMAHSLPGPVQTQHTKTEGLLAKAKSATGLEFNKETSCATHKIV
ncbi:hypothetical protein E2320_007719, partial [Naja naja]